MIHAPCLGGIVKRMVRSDPSGLLALGATDHEDINGKSFKSKANGTVQASPPKTVAPPVSPDFWTDPGGWIDHYQAEIIGAVVGTVVGIGVTAGCLALTGGVGSVGCLIAGGAAGGAVGGAITNLWKTQVTRTQQFSWGGLALDVGMGALFGGLGGGAGAGVGAVAAKVAASVASPTVRAVANGVSCAVNSFVPGTAVLLADGTAVPIEDVQLGDEVLATDPETGKTGPQPVTALITGDGRRTSPRSPLPARVGVTLGRSSRPTGTPSGSPTSDSGSTPATCFQGTGERRRPERLCRSRRSNTTTASKRCTTSPSPTPTPTTSRPEPTRSSPTTVEQPEAQEPDSRIVGS